MSRPTPSAHKSRNWPVHDAYDKALTAIVQGHRQSQIDDLLAWNYAVTM
jgi:hypothetical protein